MGPTKRVSYKDLSEPQNMYRLKLGKTTTDFFSLRGKTRLQKIWLEHGLDDEMIFSSWIGPSEAFLRQKVSDYVQSFLIHRSKYGSFRLLEDQLRPALLKYTAVYNSSESNLEKKREKYSYYEASRLQTREQQKKRLEAAEKLRIEKSIRNKDLPAVSEFAHISECPIFRAEELERNMKKLSEIPIPFSSDSFEKQVLPIMTSIAIEEEKHHRPRKSKICLKANVNAPMKSLEPHPTAIKNEIAGDSGISSANPMWDSRSSSSENDLAERFSDINLRDSGCKGSFDMEEERSSIVVDIYI